jgi:hypothetical protein
MCKRIAWLVLLMALAMLLSSRPAQADSWTFSTIPASGAVSGPRGSIIGWGYSIFNNSPNYLVLSGLNAGSFQFATTTVLFDFPIVAPGATVTLAFNAGAQMGLFQLQWNSTAPVGFVSSGLFTASAEWWQGDPFSGGIFLQTAPDQSAPYTATVAPGAVVPEPSSLLLLITGLAGVRCLRGRKSR